MQLSFLRLALLLAALGLFVGLGSAPLIDLDEGAFTAATHEMALRGDLLLTYLNGEPRYDKPILIYWLQLGSAWLLGFSEFALRLPSALMGLGWLLLVVRFTQVHAGQAAALCAAIVTVTAVGTSFILRLAMADALLNLCIASAVLLQFAWLRSPQPALIYGAWLAMALGFLTKGPVALAFPLATLFLFTLSRGRLRDFFQFVTAWRALLLFAAVALPWYAAVTLVKGPEFLQSFFFRHNLGRFTGSMGSQHRYGLFYYLPIVLLLLLPYTGLLLGLARNIRRHWQDDFSRYALILFGLAMLVFSLSANKLPHYILYGMSGLLVMLGIEASRAGNRVLLLPAAMYFAALAAMPWWLQALQASSNAYYQTMLSDIGQHFDGVFQATCGAALLVVLGLMVDRKLLVSTKLVVCGLLSAYSVSLLLLPALGSVLQLPVKHAGLVARERPEALVMFQINTPSLGVYAGKVLRRGVPAPGELAFTTIDRVGQLPAHQVLFQEKNIVLVKVLP